MKSQTIVFWFYNNNQYNYFAEISLNLLCNFKLNKKFCFINKSLQVSYNLPSYILSPSQHSAARTLSHIDQESIY